MCREKIQAAVLASYADELERSKMPGYISRYDEYEVDDFDVQYEGHPAGPPMTAGNEPPVRRAPCAATPSTPAVTSPSCVAPTSPLARRVLRKASARIITIIIGATLLHSATAFEQSLVRSVLAVLSSLFTELRHTWSHIFPRPRLIDETSDPAQSGERPLTPGRFYALLVQSIEPKESRGNRAVDSVLSSQMFEQVTP